MARSMKNQSLMESYNQDYVELCFYHWYSRGRPSIAELSRHLPEDWRGERPTTQTISKWAIANTWEERANKLDLEVRDKVQKAYVSEKVQMLSRHAELGRELQRKGEEALERLEIKNVGVALKSIELGVEMEKDSSNLEKLLATVAALEDSKLVQRMSALLSKVNMIDDSPELDESEL